MSFAVYGTKIQLPGRVESPKTFASRIYYPDIRLRQDEFDDMVSRYKQYCDKFNVLTSDIVAQVNQLARGNAALTFLCLDTITQTFPKLYEAKSPSHVQALISNGSLDFCLAIDQCRALRPFAEIERSVLECQIDKESFIKVLEKLIKTSLYKIEDKSINGELVSVMIKLGICAVSVINDHEYLEFTCPLTAVYYQK